MVSRSTRWAGATWGNQAIPLPKGPVTEEGVTGFKDGFLYRLPRRPSLEGR